MAVIQSSELSGTPKEAPGGFWILFNVKFLEAKTAGILLWFQAVYCVSSPH